MTADPRGNGHRQDKPANLGPLIIAAGIVLAGVIVAFAVIATRSQEPEPVVPVPVAVPPEVPVGTVPSPAEAPTTSPSGGGAQTVLTDTLAAAQGIQSQTGDFADATSFELATAMPEVTFLPSSTPSQGPDQVSYYGDGAVFAAASMDEDGTCWMLKDDRTANKTTYGTGPVCTGTAALSSASPSW